MNIIVKDSALKHGLTEKEILYAVENQFKSKRFFNKEREVSNIWSLSILPNGNNCEIVYSYEGLDTIIVFHAMTPARKSFIQNVERKEDGTY
jgi:hypothetical protein